MGRLGFKKSDRLPPKVHDRFSYVFSMTTACQFVNTLVNCYNDNQ
ncbi:MAG: hypothetical protein QNJ37_21930 [Crocosphaera sp.]|nr:hypothetical protein [Crocosphaera sp.]